MREIFFRGRDEDLIRGLLHAACAARELPAQARQRGINALRILQMLAAQMAGGDGGKKPAGGNQREQQRDGIFFQAVHGGGELAKGYAAHLRLTRGDCGKTANFFAGNGPPPGAERRVKAGASEWNRATKRGVLTVSGRGCFNAFHCPSLYIQHPLFARTKWNLWESIGKKICANSVQGKQAVQKLCKRKVARLSVQKSCKFRRRNLRPVVIALAGVFCPVPVRRESKNRWKQWVKPRISQK